MQKLNVISIRTFQDARIDERFQETFDRLQLQHVKIEDTVPHLAKCLAAIQITEQAIGATSASGSISEMRRSLAEAQVVLDDISERLERMGIRLP